MIELIEKTGREVTTVCTGGPIKLALIENVHTLKNFLSTTDRYHRLGFGSNTLISDSGAEFPFLQLVGEFKKLEVHSDHVFVGAGASLMSVARKLAGIVSLEFAGGIPASVGGAVAMNAGAHNGDMSSVIKEIFVVLPNGEEQIINQPKFEYRKTHLPSDAIVTGVSFHRFDTDKIVSQRTLDENLLYRKQTQPLTLPSCGSVFKNPPGEYSAGFLIEKVGLKGQVIGDVMISTVHANWIVNPSKRGRTDDVLRLIDLCKERVFKSEGVELQEEVVAIP